MSKLESFFEIFVFVGQLESYQTGGLFNASVAFPVIFGMKNLPVSLAGNRSNRLINEII